MGDWYEYAVTTRTGPGSVERPDGESWELVGQTSTALQGPPGVGVKTEHHAWWKRRKMQPATSRGPSPTSGSVGGLAPPGSPTVAPGPPRKA